MKRRNILKGLLLTPIAPLAGLKIKQIKNKQPIKLQDAVVVEDLGNEIKPVTCRPLTLRSNFVIKGKDLITAIGNDPS